VLECIDGAREGGIASTFGSTPQYTRLKNVIKACIRENMKMGHTGRNRVEVAGNICLRRPRPTHGCRADDDKTFIRICKSLFEFKKIKKSHSVTDYLT
jgi:hypothetical protein